MDVQAREDLEEHAVNRWIVVDKHGRVMARRMSREVAFQVARALRAAPVAARQETEEVRRELALIDRCRNEAIRQLGDANDQISALRSQVSRADDLDEDRTPTAVEQLTEANATIERLRGELARMKSIVPMECCQGGNPQCHGPRGCLLQAMKCAPTVEELTRQLESARKVLRPFLDRLDALPWQTWHCADLDIRVDGANRRFEADWLKDLIYALRAFLTPEPAEGEAAGDDNPLDHDAEHIGEDVACGKSAQLQADAALLREALEKVGHLADILSEKPFATYNDETIEECKALSARIRIRIRARLAETEDS